MKTFEAVAKAIQALHTRGYKRPGNMQIQGAIWNMFHVHLSLEEISYCTDRG